MHDVLVTFISPGMVHSDFAASLAGLVAHSSDRVGAVFHAGGVPRMLNLNKLSMDLINSPFEWSFQVDTDMIFPADALSRLLETAEGTGRRIISGLYFGVDNLPVFSVGRDENGDLRKLNIEHLDPLMQVTETGEGCLLIHRSIFEEILEAHPVGLPFWNDVVSDEDGSRLYEEAYFYKRALEVCGEYPIVNTEVRCTHIKTRKITYESVWKDRHG